MAYVEVPNTPITAFGRPWRIASRDDDGEVIWEDEENRKPQMEDSTTYSLIRELLLLLQADQSIRSVQKPNDGMHTHKLWNMLQKGREENFIRFGEEEHKWLLSLFSRNMPISKEAKESGISERTLAAHLFGYHEWIIQDQLKSINDRECKIEPSEDEEPSEEVAEVENTETGRKRGANK